MTASPRRAAAGAIANVAPPMDDKRLSPASPAGDAARHMLVVLRGSGQRCRVGRHRDVRIAHVADSRLVPGASSRDTSANVTRRSPPTPRVSSPGRPLRQRPFVCKIHLRSIAELASWCGSNEVTGDISGACHKSPANWRITVRPTSPLSTTASSGLRFMHEQRASRPPQPSTRTWERNAGRSGLARFSSPP